jgi:transposase-like protein
MRNALAHAGKSGRRVVSAFIGTAFAQETAEAASQQWRSVADQMRPKLPKLAVLMDEAEPDVLAYMTFPKEHRLKLHSTDEIDKTGLKKLCYAGGARATPWRRAELRL